jgi:hypothetical protein
MLICHLYIIYYVLTCSIYNVYDLSRVLIHHIIFSRGTGMIKRDIKDLVADLQPEDIKREIASFNERFDEPALLSKVFACDGRISDDCPLELYDYAINANTSYILADYNWFEVATSACAVISQVFVMFDQISGYAEITPATDLAHSAAFARLRIDFMRLGAELYEENPEVSLKQMAQLSRMTEASVRNALSKDENRPTSAKRGRAICFNALDAHKWMLGRRGYKATQFPEDKNEISQFLRTNTFGAGYGHDPETGMLV